MHQIKIIKATVLLLSLLVPTAFPTNAFAESDLIAQETALATTKTKIKTAKKAPSRKARTTRATTKAIGATADKEAPDESTSPLITPPSSLIDLYTARFGHFEVSLKDAGFLEAEVGEFKLSADSLDMNTGALEMLTIRINNGEFQHFTIDELIMSSAAALRFDTNELLNNKILQFTEPATAQVKAVVSERSLNTFLNSPEVLARLSGSAKKRLPILSALARQDVNFGFEFLSGKLVMKPDNRLVLKMDSKLGMGKVAMPVEVQADTQIALDDGWVKLDDTKLHTSGHSVPKEMAAKIIGRINSLSKWGRRSDDIQFQFTDAKVIPNDRLELAGTAMIKRLRLTRQNSEVGGSGSTRGDTTKGLEPLNVEPHKVLLEPTTPTSQKPPESAPVKDPTSTVAPADVGKN